MEKKRGEMKNRKIRVLIADDHAVVRIGLSALLGTESDISVVGVAKDGIETVEETLRLKPDVIVMDLMMPKKTGVEATADILAALPETKERRISPQGRSALSHREWEDRSHRCRSDLCGPYIRGLLRFLR